MANGNPALSFLKRVNRKYLKDDKVLLNLGLSENKNDRLVNMNDDNPGKVQDFTFNFLNFYSKNYKKLNTPMILSDSLSNNISEIGGASINNTKSKSKVKTLTNGKANLYGSDDTDDDTSDGEYIKPTIPSFLQSYVSNNPNS